jgi:hypothetical protein
MNKSDFEWSLEKVIEETRKALTENALPGEKNDDLDLSYITQELLDHYRENAKEKNVNACDDAQNKPNVACFWGNNWVIIGPNNRWSYQNNNADDGCDPVTESCLCGSGHSWKVTAYNVTGRYCSNGRRNPRMAWPRP